MSQQTSVLKEQSDQLKRSSNFLIDTLSTVVEFRSGESGQHIKRMRGITDILLKELSARHPEYGLTAEQIEMICGAATVSYTHLLKVIVDLVIFMASFTIQRDWVFKESKGLLK